MSKFQNSAFDTLLATWRRHQDLRSAGVDISELNESRIRLDTARSTMTTIR